MILNSKKIAALKSKAVHLKTTVQIGNNGITEPVIASIEEALNANQLVKISYNSPIKKDRIEASKILIEKTDSSLVQILGKIIVLYRESDK
ncbi:MAG: YhbY family RNA-binding protein [Candidatus Cloacimonetes bacterium]|nr:YhbY family RNA-binding protein [Candidatus Cloacimonadota bacterium]